MEFALWDPFSGDEFKRYGMVANIFERHLRQVQVIEQLGWDYYFTIEHQGSGGLRCTSASTVLSAMSQRTSVIRLGTMIWQLPFHNPLRLAQEVALVDQMSRGRVEFGSGIGVQEHEFVRWGLDYKKRQAMGEEALEIIKLAWASEKEFSYEGQFWSYNRALAFPRPYQQPHPPIWAGCHSKRSHEWAARQGYACAQNIDTDEDVAAHFQLYRKVWNEVQPAELPPRTFLMRPVYVDVTDAKAREAGRELVRHIYGHDNRGLVAASLGLDPSGYGGEDTEEQRGRARVREMVAQSYDWAIDNGIAIVGSPDTVAARIEEESDYCGGIDVYCVNFEFGGIDLEVAERSLELFSRHVLPALS